jgi:hypothetical protein
MKNKKRATKTIHVVRIDGPTKIECSEGHQAPGEPPHTHDHYHLRDGETGALLGSVTVVEGLHATPPHPDGSTSALICIETRDADYLISMTDLCRALAAGPLAPTLAQIEGAPPATVIQ